MAYYVRSTKGLHSEMLVEMPAREADKANKENLDTFYSRVSAQEAHRWVLAGRIHGTALYTDTVSTSKWPYNRKVIRRAGE